jgi:hypothetical protein
VVQAGKWTDLTNGREMAYLCIDNFAPDFMSRHNKVWFRVKFMPSEKANLPANPNKWTSIDSLAKLLWSSQIAHVVLIIILNG